MIAVDQLLLLRLDPICLSFLLLLSLQMDVATLLSLPLLVVVVARSWAWRSPAKSPIGVNK